MINNSKRLLFTILVKIRVFFTSIHITNLIWLKMYKGAVMIANINDNFNLNDFSTFLNVVNNSPLTPNGLEAGASV